MDTAFKPTASYLTLPQLCFEVCAPTPVREPQWIAFNAPLAATLGLPRRYWLSEAGLQLFSGNQLSDWAQPVAQAYAGHQFAHFNPQLGDGRAHLLSELCDAQGTRFDLQLKGSGPTPFSRGGDGRSPLGPVLREYVLSEAMHALGVPTTRALAAVATGEAVYRDEVEPGAILTRVARSHLRIGSFQFLLARGDYAGLRQLTDYALARHYPNKPQAALQLLHAVVEQQAALVAHWMSLGFIHGVMNTDNTSISGETIDYGPCAFMDTYVAGQKYSFIDKRGRYAYDQQPDIAKWNLARLAESLLPVMHEEGLEQTAAIEAATAAVEGFDACYQRHWYARMYAKLGVQADPHNTSAQDLVQRWLDMLARQQADFTLAFVELGDTLAEHNDAAASPNLSRIQQDADYLAWQQAWQALRLPTEQATAQMAQVNPRRIARNHQVQAVIAAAYTEGDLRPFQALQEALAKPFAKDARFTQYEQPPGDEEVVANTFCGT